MSNNKFSISTDRLDIIVPCKDNTNEILNYWARNKQHFSPWEPIRNEEYYTEAFWGDKLEKYQRLYSDFSAVNLFARLKDDDKIICQCSYTNIIKGVFQCCSLGFSVDQNYEGMGYMSEALRASIEYIFSKGIHRIQANHLPTNERSAKLLKRLDFAVEGYARDYLFINGEWKDHVLTSLTSKI